MKYSNYRILEDTIVFDYYAFRFSSLRENNTLSLDRIINVNFNTFPYSMEIDGGEIIFFNHRDEKPIKAFAQKHKIPISTTLDIWGMLCSPFLDTELSETELNYHQQKLKELNFSTEDIAQIRKKVKSTLFGTWEWQYLGQWDLLAMKPGRSLFYRFTGRKFYWWTMKISLKYKQR